MLKKYSIEDATVIAPYYDLTFGASETDIGPENIKIAQSILLGTEQKSFAKISLEVGEALWRNDTEKLKTLQKMQSS